jgi:hypothetical protein
MFLKYGLTNIAIAMKLCVSEVKQFLLYTFHPINQINPLEALKFTMK